MLAEVASIDADTINVTPFVDDHRIELGARVTALSGQLTLSPHESWLGRTLNALGQPIDSGEPLIEGDRAVGIQGSPPSPMLRNRLGQALTTGVKAIDLFTPICAGQRIGIFAGSGVGKSTLLAMLSRAPSSDVTVLALVGERSREVRDFLDDTLGATRARVVAVVATSDESPMMRRLAPSTAMCIAEHFRDHGKNVLLIVDSLTRYAHSMRELALAADEPPVARGYPPSVFSDLPRLLERAGTGEDGAGTITAILSVLVDGDDHNDPIADATRGILDGHIVLDRAIASQGRLPAVDPFGLAVAVGAEDTDEAAGAVRDAADRIHFPVRRHARSARHRRLQGRQRPDARSGHGSRAPALRCNEAGPRRAARRRCLRVSVAKIARCTAADFFTLPIARDQR